MGGAAGIDPPACCLGVFQAMCWSGDFWYALGLMGPLSPSRNVHSRWFLALMGVGPIRSFAQRLGRGKFVRTRVRSIVLLYCGAVCGGSDLSGEG